MARKKGLFASIMSSGRKTSMTRRFSAAMLIRRTGKPTKLTKAKSRSGLFH